MMAAAGTALAAGAKGGLFGPMLGGILGSAGSLIGQQLALGSASADRSQAAKIALANMWMQGQTNAKNEQLMREAWAREDNAVQRRVADLRKAGLSPTLAAGSAASASGPIQVRAPELQGILNNRQAAQLASVEMAKNIAQTTMSQLTQYYQTKIMRAEAQEKEARAVYSKVNALEEMRQNVYRSEVMSKGGKRVEAEIRATKQRTYLDYLNSIITGADADYVEKFGRRPGNEVEDRVFRMIQSMIDIGEKHDTAARLKRDAEISKKQFKEIAEKAKNRKKRIKRNMSNTLLGEWLGWNEEE